jgi:hypothetical protein
MAFIYTALNTDWVNNPGLEPLVARVYANGVDVYPARLNGGVFTPPHELRGCTKFQWEFDPERDGTYVKISGATTDTYQVPEDDVSNSGNYRCVITIGESEGECGSTVTDVRTIAIIDCGNMSRIFFAGTGGAGSRAINLVYPHFILPSQVSATSSDWATNSQPTCTLSNGNCTETLSLTAESVTAGGRSNTARNGYVDIQIGELTCFWNLQQDFIRTQAGDTPVDADLNPPLGPTLVLNATQARVVQNGIIKVTATSTVIGQNGPLTTDSGFTWDDPTGDLSSFAPPTTVNGVSTQTAIVDTTTLGIKTLTFSVTVGNFTETKDIKVTVSAAQPAEQIGEISGDYLGEVQARKAMFIIWDQDEAKYYNRTLATANGNFTVQSGQSTIKVSLNDGRGYGFNSLRPFGGKAIVRFTIEGPSIANGRFSQDLSVTPEPLDPNPEPYFNSQGDVNPNYSYAEPTVTTIPPSAITGTADGLLGPGNYSWSLDLHRVAGVENDGSIASGSPYGDGSGVVVRQQNPYQETITDPEGNHLWASYTYNPIGSMTVIPVGGFLHEYLSPLDFDY